jgi:hypothetical protein
MVDWKLNTALQVNADIVPTDTTREALNDAIALLEDTWEHPFVVIAFADYENAGAEVFVRPTVTEGQYHVVKRSRATHTDGKWRDLGTMSLHRAVQTLIERANRFHATETTLYDQAAVRQETSIKAFAESDVSKYNRRMCFDGVSPVPSFVRHLVTEPAYDKAAAREQGIRQHERRLAAEE